MVTGINDAQYWCAIACILMFYNFATAILAIMLRSEALRLKAINDQLLEMNHAVVSAMAGWNVDEEDDNDES